MSILDIFRSEKRKVADSSGDTLRMTNSGGVNYVDSSAYESRNINITDIEIEDCNMSKNDDKVSSAVVITFNKFYKY